MRAFAAVLALWLIGLALAPGVIVADFLVERERIDRELCVQRLVPEEVRTCHGQCYLMRSLQRVEQQEQRLPERLRDLRLPEYVVQRTASPQMPAKVAVHHLFVEGPAARLPEGWRSALEPVPWG